MASASQQKPQFTTGIDQLEAAGKKKLVGCHCLKLLTLSRRILLEVEVVE